MPVGRGGEVNSVWVRGACPPPSLPTGNLYSLRPSNSTIDICDLTDKKEPVNSLKVA